MTKRTKPLSETVKRAEYLVHGSNEFASSTQNHFSDLGTRNDATGVLQRLETLEYLCLTGEISAIRDFLSTKPALFPTKELAILELLVEAVEGSRNPLHQVLVDGLAGQQLVRRFRGHLLAEDLNTEVLSHFVSYFRATHDKPVGIVESLITFAQIWAKDFPSLTFHSFPGTSHPESERGHARRESIELAMAASTEAEEVDVLEFARTAAEMSHPRLDHLSGSHRTPSYGKGATTLLSAFPGLEEELELRKLLDIASDGDWKLTVLKCRKLLQRGGLSPDRDGMIKLLHDYSQLQDADSVEYGSRLHDKTQVGEPHLAHLVDLFTLMAKGTEPFLLSSFDTQAHPRSIFSSASQAIESNWADLGSASLVELGHVADELMKGSRFQRSLAVWLRVFQAHSLLLRGHYSYALRVSNYSIQLLSRLGMHRATCVPFAEKDNAVLVEIMEG